jgi:hypothetical protein
MKAPARAALLALPLAFAACGPKVTDARTLWFDSPVDGTLALVDHQPPPF